MSLTLSFAIGIGVCVLYAICKDMDGLDRVRFNGLDILMLRTPYAKKLPLIAGCLLQENIVNVVFYPPKE